jgi:hypothetical protein
MVRVMILRSTASSSSVEGGAASWKTGTPSRFRVDAVEHQAMQMNIQIGGGAEALDECDPAFFNSTPQLLARDRCAVAQGA